MIPRLPLLVLAAALAAPTVASALGDRVIISCRYGNAICLDEFSDFEAALTDAGAQVEVRTDVPSIIADGDVRLLVVALPMDEWETQESNLYLPGFLSQGGRLVLLGDNEDSEATTNGWIRDVLDGIPNHDLELDATTYNLNPQCTDPPTTDLLGDPLTAGASSWYLAQVATVSGGDPLIRFEDSEGGGTQVLASVARLPSGGEIVLFGDVEGFLSGVFADCLDGDGVDLAAAHDALWTNLFTVPTSAIDTDGDGYGNDVDCNDNNPQIHPDADEECNGVDDNCDGKVDEGCGDDDDDSTAGDDDDDDSTASDDDDSTSGVLGDDDDDPFDDARACDCGSDEASARPGLLAWLVLPFGAFSLRRRRTP